MKIKGKLLSIAVTLTISSAALVIAAPKHAPHVQHIGGHGKTSFGAKGGGQKKLAGTGKAGSGTNGLGDQPDAGLTPTPTPTPIPDASPSPSARP